MSLLSSIASIFGAGSQKKAVQAASNEQLAYTQKGIDAINGAGAAGQAALASGTQQGLGYLTGAGGDTNAMVAQLLSAFTPYTQSGNAAQAGVNDLLGLHGADPQNAAVEGISASPLYQRLLGQGQNAILQNASATGGLRGGNVQDALAGFSTDLLNQQVQQRLTNLSGVAGQGLNAVGTSAQTGLAGQNQSNTIAQLMATLSGNQGANSANLSAQQAQALASLFGDQGTARASGITGSEAATQLQYKGGLNAIGDIVSAFFPGGGSFI